MCPCGHAWATGPWPRRAAEDPRVRPRRPVGQGTLRERGRDHKAAPEDPRTAESRVRALATHINSLAASAAMTSVMRTTSNDATVAFDATPNALDAMNSTPNNTLVDDPMVVDADLRP